MTEPDAERGDDEAAAGRNTWGPDDLEIEAPTVDRKMEREDEPGGRDQR